VENGPGATSRSRMAARKLSAAWSRVVRTGDRPRPVHGAASRCEGARVGRQRRGNAALLRRRSEATLLRLHTQRNRWRRTLEQAPFELSAGEPLHLRVFVDRSVVEVHANQRRRLAVASIRDAATAWASRSSPRRRREGLHGEGLGDDALESLLKGVKYETNGSCCPEFVCGVRCPLPLVAQTPGKAWSEKWKPRTSSGSPIT